MSREAWQAEWHPLVEAVDLPMVPNYPSVRERQVTWIGAFPCRASSRSDRR